MYRLIKLLNAIAIINIIIIIALFCMFIVKIIFPSPGLLEFGALLFLIRLVYAILVFHILAIIHTIIICLKGKNIISAYVHKLKDKGFPFSEIFIMKCMQTIFIIIIFVINIKYIDGYFFWEQWIRSLIAGILTSIIFVKSFCDVEFRPISHLLWIYTILPITDILILALLNHKAKESDTDRT